MMGWCVHLYDFWTKLYDFLRESDVLSAVSGWWEGWSLVWATRKDGASEQIAEGRVEISVDIFDGS